MSLWGTGNKSKYRQPAYGFTLGSFVIRVAEKLAQPRPGLFRFEYQEALMEARSYMQSLVAAIPDEVLKKHGIDAEKLINEIDNMGKRELLQHYHRIVNILDSEGLLIPKKRGQPQEIPSIDEE